MYFFAINKSDENFFLSSEVGILLYGVEKKMAGVQQRLKLKQTPIDTWSVKEHLTLASAVLRTGDQVGFNAQVSRFFLERKFRIQVGFN